MSYSEMQIQLSLVVINYTVTSVGDVGEAFCSTIQSVGSIVSLSRSPFDSVTSCNFEPNIKMIKSWFSPHLILIVRTTLDALCQYHGRKNP